MMDWVGWRGDGAVVGSLVTLHIRHEPSRELEEEASSSPVLTGW